MMPKDERLGEGTADMVRGALAETLGSMAFFYGSSIVRLPPGRDGNRALYASTSQCPWSTACP